MQTVKTILSSIVLLALLGGACVLALAAIGTPADMFHEQKTSKLHAEALDCIRRLPECESDGEILLCVRDQVGFYVDGENDELSASYPPDSLAEQATRKLATELMNTCGVQLLTDWN